MGQLSCMTVSQLVTGDQGTSAVAGLEPSTQQFPIGICWLLEKGPEFPCAGSILRKRQLIAIRFYRPPVK